MAVEATIDMIRRDGKGLILLGWAINTRNGEKQINFRVTDQKHQKEVIDCKSCEREDVIRTYFPNQRVRRQAGMEIRIPDACEHGFELEVKSGFAHKKIVFTEEEIHEKLIQSHLYDVEQWRKMAEEGNVPGYIYYDNWYELTAPTQNELQKQKAVRWEPDAPLFSIVVPVYNPKPQHFHRMIESVIHQTYSKWELCLADGSDKEDPGKILEEYADEERIHYQRLPENLGISGNTNAAIRMAGGNYIVFVDDDDLLREDALYEFAKAIQKNPDTDYLYSDEDKTDDEGRFYFEPHFKPDFNPDLLRTTNYISHLSGVKKSLLEQTGLLRENYDGAQDYDFILRVCEKAQNIIHISKVLYHWRTAEGSTAARSENKKYAFDAGARAIRDHYARMFPSIKIDHIDDHMHPGIYQTVFRFDNKPLVSVLIPNKDHVKDLSRLLDSFSKCTWDNLEFIIIENNSIREETFAYYNEIQQKNRNVKVVQYPGSFNYSRINNFGEKYARGKYLLLLNNDMELINPDSVEAMMGYGQRDDVGIVGARLLYPDRTFQHAGVVIGLNGAANHLFQKQSSEDAKTYFDLGLEARDVSAVTGACMLVRKDLYEKLNGLDEDFAVAYNDIDFCLRCIRYGKKVVYTPHACLIHYESASRGNDFSEEKVERFIQENKMFIQRYEYIMKNGDPFYNVNLSHVSTDCSIRNPLKEPYGIDPYTPEKVEKMIRKVMASQQSES